MEFWIKRNASFLRRMEKSSAQIMTFTITVICCTQLTTHSLLKYHWRRQVLKCIWSCLNSENCENCVVKTISQLVTKLSRSVLVIFIDIVHIHIRSCHTSGHHHHSCRSHATKTAFISSNTLRCLSIHLAVAPEISTSWCQYLFFFRFLLIVSL